MYAMSEDLIKSELREVAGYIRVRHELDLGGNSLKFKEYALRTFAFCIGTVLASSKEEA
jgi:hypothetical protein